MNIVNLLQPRHCSCGKTHRCDIKHVFIEKDAISHLVSMTAAFKNILLVADENTFKAAGEKCEKYLYNKSITKQIFSGTPLLIPNEKAICAIENKLEGIELIIGIGSGVIQDLCKYVSYTSSIPYYIVATAPSMDGYASSGAALIIDGMKVTYSTKVPDGFIGDTEILKNAPLEMIKAGYGDIIGKYSALNDWKLAQSVYGEYFCDYIYNLTFDMLREVLPLSKKLLSRDEKAIKSLTEALIGVGIAMAYAENSRPASGSEHHLSHFFEITGILNNEDYLPHGIDVFYSTFITAKIREKLLSATLPENPYHMQDDEYAAQMKRVFSSIADSCISLHRKTNWYNDNRMPIYKAKWEEICDIFKEMPPSSEIEALLFEVGLNTADFTNKYSKERIEDAIKYAKDLKDRFTVLWVYYDIFGNEVNL